MSMNNDNTLQAELDALGRSQAVIYFTPDGIILDANQNFLNAVGYTLDEIKGKHHKIFCDNAYINSTEYTQFWRNLAKGEFNAKQFKRITKSGKEIWIEASYNPIVDNNGHVIKVVKYATDITAQKLQDANFSGQIDAINRSQAVIEFNMDGTIITANKNFLDTVGYTLDEVKGKHHRMFVDSNYAQSREYKDFWKKLNEGQFFSDEFCRYGKHNKEVWINASYNPIFDMNGKSFKVVKYATDISEQKFKNADFSGQIDAISKSQAIIQFELDGTIITANENFLSTTGYRLNEIVGQHHSMFVDSKYAKSREYQDLWSTLNKGIFVSGEYQRFGKGGKEIWINASYNPIFDAHGYPFKVVKYATDITAQMFAKNNSQKLTSNLHDTSSSIAAAIEEMTASIEEISQSMIDSNHAVNDITSKIKDADDLMGSLKDTAKSMETVVDFIRDIAEQVNLLALNATIEAARAGDAGRSFAVVAAEVKRLASQVGKATSDIAEKITSLQKISHLAVESSKAINQKTSAVSTSVNSVTMAIREQNIVTREIADNMVKTSHGIDQLNECIKSITKAA